MPDEHEEAKRDNKHQETEQLVNGSFGGLGSDQMGSQAACPHAYCVAGHTQGNGCQEDKQPSPERYGGEIGHQCSNGKKRVERAYPTAGLCHFQARVCKVDGVALPECLDSDAVQTPHCAFRGHSLHGSREAVVDHVGQWNREEQKGERKGDKAQMPPSTEEQNERSEGCNEADALREHLSAGRAQDEHAHGQDKSKDAKACR